MESSLPSPNTDECFELENIATNTPLSAGPLGVVSTISETEVSGGAPVIPLLSQDKIPIVDRSAKEANIDQEFAHHDAEESTLDDYEAVPVEGFGKDMLQRMELKEIPEKANHKGNEPGSNPAHPPGTGLGFVQSELSKAINVQLPPTPGGVLRMKVGAQVKIVAGSHEGRYGTIEHLNTEEHRVIVKLATDGTNESINENSVALVSKQEYDRYIGVLNHPTQNEESTDHIAIRKRKLEKMQRTTPYIKYTPVQVLDGTYKGSYGKIQGVGDDVTHVFVNLVGHSTNDFISTKVVKVVSEQEYNQNTA